MSQSYFIVCLLVISIADQLLVSGTPTNGAVHVGSHEGENDGQVEPLALQELGQFNGKTYWLGSNTVTQNMARTECSNAGFDLLRMTGGTEELEFIQQGLTDLVISSCMWTDYSHVQENDCFRSNDGEDLPQSLIIDAAHSNMYVLGLTISRSGGFSQLTTHGGCRYICT